MNVVLIAKALDLDVEKLVLGEGQMQADSSHTLQELSALFDRVQCGMIPPDQVEWGMGWLRSRCEPMLLLLV